MANFLRILLDNIVSNAMLKTINTINYRGLVCLI